MLLGDVSSKGARVVIGLIAVRAFVQLITLLGVSFPRTTGLLSESSCIFFSQEGGDAAKGGNLVLEALLGHRWSLALQQCGSALHLLDERL